MFDILVLGFQILFRIQARSHPLDGGLSDFVPLILGTSILQHPRLSPPVSRIQSSSKHYKQLDFSICSQISGSYPRECSELHNIRTNLEDRGRLSDLRDHDHDIRRVVLRLLLHADRNVGLRV